MTARWLSGLLVGALVGGIAFLIGMFSVGPGNGSEVPSVLLFPFTRLLSAYFDPGMAVLVGVALAQYPLYGAVIGLSRPLRLGLACIVAVHVAAAALALYVLGLVLV